jgi:hypothetical protein
MARSRNTADTQTASGGPVSPGIAGKNAIINGGMDIWQRGTSVAASASTTPYTADRWQLKNNASQAMTVSRQATNDTTNLPNIQYCARIQRNSGQTGTTVYYFANQFESVNSIPLAGKTVTLSFYARSGADFSPTSSLIGVTLYGGTGTDQNIITGSYTGGANIATQNSTLTTTWQRFTMTGTVPATVTEISVYFAATPTGTASTNDYMEITGVQLEVGSSATPFSRAGGTIQGELAACQRYFSKSYNSDVAPGTITDVGATFYKTAFTDSFQTWMVFFPVQMRSTPTMTFYSPADGATGNSSVSGTNRATTAAGQTGASGTGAYINNVSIANANLIKSHWTASIEL